MRVPPEAAGERLDRFLAGRLGSRSAAAAMLARGALLDGRSRPKSHRLAGGELLQLSAEVAPTPPSARDMPVPRVVWSDEYLAVVDKPAGLVVHAGAGRPDGTLVDALGPLLGGGEEGRRGIVHRLDRGTSGLLVVARSEEAHRRLSGLVRRRELGRDYLALVRGRPRSRSGRIEAAIGRDRDDPTRVSLESDRPREAVTHFDVMRVYERHALLQVRLETGRMHQIRVHLAAIELPIVGDALYGVQEPPLERPFLHAAELSFRHPFSGERLELRSPLPEDLQAHLDALG